MTNQIAFESGRGAETAILCIGKLQAGEACFTDKLYLVHPKESLSELRITAHADQLRAPLELVVPVSILVTTQTLSVDQIKDYAEKLGESG
ncbi:hypothetical protein BL248_23610 [Ralstonia solanacearum]|nr:hypothetical protein BL248_23610 [Ralstonia solanacearum]